MERELDGGESAGGGDGEPRAPPSSTKEENAIEKEVTADGTRKFSRGGGDFAGEEGEGRLETSFLPSRVKDSEIGFNLGENGLWKRGS